MASAKRVDHNLIIHKKPSKKRMHKVEAMVNQKDLERTLALAGLFQAARIVSDIATNGTTETNSFEESINSIFALDPESLTDIYASEYANRLGLNTIESIFGPEASKDNSEVITYAFAMIHLERILSRRRRLLGLIRNGIKKSQQQVRLLDSRTHNSVISKLANIYIDSLGSLNYRIQVRGKSCYLTNPLYVDKVRASLLAGIRSAMLWRQLGGRRWHLFFIRRRLLSAARKLTVSRT